MTTKSSGLVKRRKQAQARKRANRTTDSSFKIGRVHVYLRGKVWYIRYHEKGRRIQQRVGPNKSQTKQLAAEINSQVECGIPSAFGFEQCRLGDLRLRWLAHHEDIKRSSLATIARYRSATTHLIQFAENRSLPHPADFKSETVEQFVRYLRTKKVAANGHENSAKRCLRDAGVKYILQTCSNLFNYAKRHRHLPPYSDNPFLAIEVGNIPIGDAKPIEVLTRDEECRLLEICDTWQFPIMLTLLQTGMRPRELVHLLLPTDLDLENGWINVTNKLRLGWQVKTKRERSIPITAELAAVLRITIGNRVAGPVFRQRRCDKGHVHELNGWETVSLERELLARAKQLESTGIAATSRLAKYKAAHSIWRDVGATRYEYLRIQFIKLMKKIARPDITTLKTFRHNFATCLQDANVDPLIRNELLGHSPGGLGMTTRYTQTRPETKKRQLLNALDDQESTRFARNWLDENG